MSQMGDPEAMARLTEFTKNIDQNSGVPGGALSDDVLKPELLGRNMRANLFPKEQARIFFTIRNALVRNAARQILFIEEAHQSQCPRPHLQTVKLIAAHNVLAAADNSAVLVGVEEWGVDRCGLAQTYRVNYFKRADDEFFSEVEPTNAAGYKDLLMSKLRRFVFM